MKYKVIAVVVTCNRCELLKMSLNALFTSDYYLEKIIVINNASEDGTKEYLDTINDDRLLTIHKEVNEGGAGGFYYGIKEAYLQGCDFVWIMDDDTIVTPFALNELINGYEILKDREIGFLASNVFWKDNTPCKMNICNTSYDYSQFAGEGLIKITHCSFVSMLIPTWVVKEVGFPIKEYFIWGDDGEYSTRILRKYEGYLCGKSVVHHYMNDNIGVDIFNVNRERIDRFFYFYRNWMCTHRMRGVQEVKQYKKDTRTLIWDICRSNTKYKYEKILTILKGINAGRKFNVEIEFPEGTENSYETPLVSMSQKYKGIKKVLFKMFRYFGIKYDIKTQGNVIYCRELYGKYCRTNPNRFQKAMFIWKGYRKINRYNSEDNKGIALKALLENVDIKLCKSKYFAYAVDYYKTWRINYRQMGNCIPDYELFLENGINDLILDKNDEFSTVNNIIIKSIDNYIVRLKNIVKRSKHPNKIQIEKWLTIMPYSKAGNLEEALQRILIMNQLLWQTRHIQIGLGRLDYILEDYITPNYTDEYLLDLIKDFISVLHNFYWLKSEEMLGDTGQIIILGGVNKNGNKNINNRLTYTFIRAVKELQLPDPKVLLRVNKETPTDLIELACDCISTGIGCPIIANDERVLPSLYNFGYEREDANDYVTSACWEIIPANSCEQNNIGVFDFAKTFDLLARKENLNELDSWEAFIGKFAEHLCGNVWFMANLTNGIEWDKDPLLSSLKKACRASSKDVALGGCKYNNYGILSLGLSNTVNSLINIRKYVYEKKQISLKEIFLQRSMNFPNEDIRKLLSDSTKFFGDDTDTKEDVLGLTNWLIGLVNETLSPITNKFGGHIKFGLSSPGYITVGTNAGATFDGRFDKQPYAVHISNDSANEPTAIVNFAGKLLHGKNGFNGNVVDVMFSSNLIKDNLSQFASFIKGSIVAGIFELQMNVLSYETLLAARKNPEAFPNLIVRVWGFSSYFKDIPDEYKDYLIERARLNEATS